MRTISFLVTVLLAAVWSAGCDDAFCPKLEEPSCECFANGGAEVCDMPGPYVRQEDANGCPYYTGGSGCCGCGFDGDDGGDADGLDGGDDEKPDGDYEKPDGDEDGKPDSGDEEKPDGGEGVQECTSLTDDCKGGAKCLCCGSIGPQEICLCTQDCDSGLDCDQPNLPTCNQPSADTPGICTPKDYNCCWFCQ